MKKSTLSDLRPFGPGHVTEEESRIRSKCRTPKTKVRTLKYWRSLFRRRSKRSLNVRTTSSSRFLFFTYGPRKLSWKGPRDGSLKSNKRRGLVLTRWTGSKNRLSIVPFKDGTCFSSKTFPFPIWTITYPLTVTEGVTDSKVTPTDGWRLSQQKYCFIF